MNILFICTGNWDRSPTAEMVFKDFPGWNIRSAGTSSSAGTPVKKELIDWADKIVVMEYRHRDFVNRIDPMASEKIIVLGIDDCYNRYSAKLIGLLIYRMAQVFNLDSWIFDKYKS